MTQVRLVNVHKTFQKTNVIKGVDLEINSGEFMVFVGPSGCGKSTMLRLISGLEEVTDGEIFFGDKDVTRLSPSNRRIAMVFQSYALYPHMTVYENIAFGMKLAGRTKDEVKQHVLNAAEMLQLSELLERKPAQLSGGQRQRVAIGRAIVRNPSVFLFDEPLSNLDAALRVATRLEIANLHGKMHDTTMVYVTHDQTEAMTLADRICVLRDGLIEQVGTPDELYENPNSLFVAGFIGSPKMNFLTEEYAQKYNATTIGIRPEDLDICDANDTPEFSGTVMHIENMGSDVFIYVDINVGEPLLIRRDKNLGATKEEKLNVKLKPGVKVHQFNAEGKATT